MKEKVDDDARKKRPRSPGDALESIPRPPSKKWSTIYMLGIFVLVCTISLFGLNYWHSTRCTESHTPDEIDDMLVTLKDRLRTVETETIQQSLILEDVILHMHYKLADVEDHELGLWQALSQDNNAHVSDLQAAQLLLSKQPSPLKQKYTLHDSYQDFNVLIDQINSVLKGIDDPERNKVRKGNFDDDFFLDTGFEKGHSFGDEKKNNFGDDDWMGTGNGNPEKSSITVNEAIKMCNEWHSKYGVVPSVSWGSLSYDLQRKWLKIKCDQFIGKTPTEDAKNGANQPPSIDTAPLQY